MKTPSMGSGTAAFTRPYCIINTAQPYDIGDWDKHQKRYNRRKEKRRRLVPPLLQEQPEPRTYHRREEIDHLVGYFHLSAHIEI